MEPILNETLFFQKIGFDILFTNNNDTNLGEWIIDNTTNKVVYKTDENYLVDLGLVSFLFSSWILLFFDGFCLQLDFTLYVAVLHGVLYVRVLYVPVLYVPVQYSV